jgi:multiple sugar transport system permease protein
MQSLYVDAAPGAERRRGFGFRLLKRLGLHRAEARAGYLFTAPGLVLILIFVLVPMVSGLTLSFFKWDIFSPPNFTGIDNYLRLFKDPLYLAAIRNTAYFACVSAPISAFIALLLAMFINERWFKGKIIFSTIYFIPVVMSMVSVALIWRWIFDSEFGLLNAVLKLVGLAPQLWLVNPRWVIPSMMLVNIWKTLGYNMVIFLAGLQGISKEYYEAAEIDGASRFDQFRHISLPLLRPATMFATVISIIQSFQILDLVYVFVGERGPSESSIVAVFNIYLTAFRSYEMGYASAQAAVLFLIIVVFSAVLIKLFSSPAGEA